MSKNRLCSLTGDEGKKFNCKTFSDMLDKVGLFSKYHLARSKEIQNLDEVNDVFGLGFSVIIENKWSQKLHVGISDFGWIIIKIKPKPTAIIAGNIKENKKKIVAFFFPEWTEFYIEELTDIDFSINIIKIWLDTNTIREDLFD